MTRFEFNIMFRNRVRAALKTAKETGNPPNLTALPRERRLTIELTRKGQLHPVDLEQMIREEVALGV
jgi:hypothetical protein